MCKFSQINVALWVNATFGLTIVYFLIFLKNLSMLCIIFTLKWSVYKCLDYVILVIMVGCAQNKFRATYRV